MTCVRGFTTLVTLPFLASSMKVRVGWEDTQHWRWVPGLPRPNGPLDGGWIDVLGEAETVE